jgi:hypothetical protein
MSADYRMMDPALEALAPYGADLRNGLTSHAPMVVEALAALGRPDAVLPWLDAYRAELLPREPEREPIPRDAWRGALGRYQRIGDWNAFFAVELGEAPWRDVVARWVPRLLPGLCASANHGVIRVGHAARALLDADTPQRRRELADALGMWAAAYQELPARGDAGRGLPAADALARVAVVPEAQRRFTGTITSSLEALDDFPRFADALHLLDVGPDPETTLSDVSETFARVFLSNARDLLSAIVFVHAITDVAAVRTLLPLLSDDAGRAGVRFAWQASAALYAAFATAPPVVGEVEPPAESEAELVDRAIAGRDDHAIKLTETCLREHALRPAPVYLAAARRVSELLPGA